MSKGDRQRPGNRERIGESFDRMFGRRCVKHHVTECAQCFWPRIGDRVYVKQLDVFGKVQGKTAAGEYEVQCEPPMPNYVWTGGSDWLRPEGDYLRD